MDISDTTFDRIVDQCGPDAIQVLVEQCNKNAKAVNELIKKSDLFEYLATWSASLGYEVINLGRAAIAGVPAQEVLTYAVTLGLAMQALARMAYLYGTMEGCPTEAIKA